jgi:hypothetical protein
MSWFKYDIEDQIESLLLDIQALDKDLYYLIRIIRK